MRKSRVIFLGCSRPPNHPVYGPGVASRRTGGRRERAGCRLQPRRGDRLFANILYTIQTNKCQETQAVPAQVEGIQKVRASEL